MWTAGKLLFQSHWWPPSPCCDAEDAGVLLQGRDPSLAHCPLYKKQMELEQAPLHHGSPQHLTDLACNRDKCTLDLLDLVLQHYHMWPQEVLSFAHSWLPGRVMLSPS